MKMVYLKRPSSKLCVEGENVADELEVVRIKIDEDVGPHPSTSTNQSVIFFLIQEWDDCIE